MFSAYGDEDEFQDKLSENLIDLEEGSEPKAVAENFDPSIKHRHRSKRAQRTYHGFRVNRSPKCREVSEAALALIADCLKNVFESNQRVNINHFVVRVKPREDGSMPSTVEQIRILGNEHLEAFRVKLRNREMQYQGERLRRMGYIAFFEISPVTGNVHVHLFVISTLTKRFSDSLGIWLRETFVKMSPNCTFFYCPPEDDRFMLDGTFSFAEAFEYISYGAKAEGWDYLPREFRPIRYCLTAFKDGDGPKKSEKQLFEDSQRQFFRKERDWFKTKAMSFIKNCKFEYKKAASLASSLDEGVLKKADEFLEQSKSLIRSSVNCAFEMFNDQLERLVRSLISQTEPIREQLSRVLRRMHKAVQSGFFVNSPLPGSPVQEPPMAYGRLARELSS